MNDSPVTDSVAPDMESLLIAHGQCLQALMQNDVEALSRVVAEEMRFIGPDGHEITRPDVVDALSNGRLIIEKMYCYDISMRLYGDVGVLLYSADARSSDGVTTYEGKVRCTTVYAWRDARWQMVSQHQSRLI